ncbi:MAG TPA: hypothetical protein VGO97_03620 [Solirubrobacterales bacterium]|jgi:F0F1-type ATP synthase assembly protein I|nr:hypothetical protein [Solirubrobacterales bacterium]
MDSPRATTLTAGSLLIAAIVLCAMAGFAVGKLVGAVAICAILGGFLGIGAGFALVYRRFKDI